MNFKDSIDKSGEMQLEFLLCQMLGRTPAEIRELERQGLLTFEQKLFIQAGIIWKREKFSGCPFF